MSDNGTMRDPFVPQDDWTLISQGAEARLWKIPNYAAPPTKDGSPSSLPRTAIAKERFSKSYRHAVLDERLTRQRCRAEARLLEKCLKKGISVPAVLRVEAPILYLEYLEDHSTLREHLEELLKEDEDDGSVLEWAETLGRVLAKLHGIGICHGDLTTSNMMVPSNKNNDKQLVLIDFGLAKNTESAEERAVDLYVLERALTSTHPKLPANFLDSVLHVYKQSGGDKATLSRLEQVRLRGRKRECFG